MKNILIFTFLSAWCQILNAQTYCLTINFVSDVNNKVTYSYNMTVSTSADASIGVNGTGDLNGNLTVIGGTGAGPYSGTFEFTKSGNSGTYGYTLDNVTYGGVISQASPYPSLTASCTPLPVELISLKATPIGKAVQLDWITASEKNSSHYEIERSADAKSYTTLGKVEASGNSFSKLNYTFTDEKPLSGINYYRLKMVDKDESYQYSKIVSAAFNTSFQKIAIKAYPNPASYTIAVEPFEGFKSLNIYSLQGALLMKSTTVEANISSLNSGIYFLEVENTEGYVSRVKFVKN